MHLKIIGVIFIILSSIHAFFPRYFNWGEELSRLSLINRQVMKVHTFFIAAMVFLIGLLCFIDATELAHTHLGHHICLGLGIFWFARLIFQLFVYSSTLWKGKLFETTVHIMFTLLWIYSSVVFLSIAFKG